MNKISQVISNLHEIDNESAKRNKNSQVTDEAKLIVTLAYIVVVVSFKPHDLFGVLSMFAFLIVSSILQELSILKAIKKMRFLIAFLLIAGIANPIFDREVMFHIGNVNVTSGFITMTTLLIKGFFTICASYFLVLQIGVDGMCRAMYRMHFPKSIVTMVSLMYRYVIVLLKEVERMNIAYKLRSPKQKGIHISAWGSYVGLLLTRSIDRGETVYDCMLMRGFNGAFYTEKVDKEKLIKSILFVLFWVAFFVFLRVFPVFLYIGKMFV